MHFWNFLRRKLMFTCSNNVTMYYYVRSTREDTSWQYFYFDNDTVRSLSVDVMIIVNHLTNRVPLIDMPNKTIHYIGTAILLCVYT